jgi:hypothetical protein
MNALSSLYKNINQVNVVIMMLFVIIVEDFKHRFDNKQDWLQSF